MSQQHQPASAASKRASKSPRAGVTGRAMGLRFALLGLGGLSLIVGMNFGLVLLGFDAPLHANNLEELHAQLMVFGFLGTLISLERAVAARKLWAFVAPAGFGLGAILLLSGLPQQFGEVSQLIGAIGLVACYRVAWKRVPSTSLAIEILGAVLAVGAAILWLGGTSTDFVVPWICGFIILTIVGERLDLARLNIGSQRAEAWALGFAIGVAVGAVSSLMWSSWGLVIFGASLLALVAWLLRYDIALQTIKSSGLPRFTAACLLCGYAWLAFAAIMWIAVSPTSSTGMYDLTIHAVFIGFAFSMVLGHAPIILPAVLGRALPYRAFMWVPLVLLQASLLVRVFVGDLRDVTWAWQAGGATNVAAILLFMLVAVASVIIGIRAGATTSTSSDSGPVAPSGPVGLELPIVTAGSQTESRRPNGTESTGHVPELPIVKSDPGGGKS